MTIERIRMFLDERPLRAPDLHTSDGKKVNGKAPDFAWSHPRGQTMYVCPDPQVDADEIIDLVHVTKLTQGPQRRGGNGRRRTRK
jgi:hypothetical protein